jgi:hypothetical protein
MVNGFGLMLLRTQLFQSFQNYHYGIPIAQIPSRNPLTIPYGCFIISGSHIPETLPLTPLEKGKFSCPRRLQVNTPDLSRIFHITAVTLSPFAGAYIMRESVGM